jgi:hypothetical protein
MTRHPALFENYKVLGLTSLIWLLPAGCMHLPPSVAFSSSFVVLTAGRDSKLDSRICSSICCGVKHYDKPKFYLTAEHFNFRKSAQRINYSAGKTPQSISFLDLLPLSPWRWSEKLKFFVCILIFDLFVMRNSTRDSQLPDTFSIFCSFFHRYSRHIFSIGSCEIMWRIYFSSRHKTFETMVIVMQFFFFF